MSFDYVGLSDDVAKETWTGSGATTRSYSYDANGTKIGITDTARSANLLYGYNPHGDISQLIPLAGAARAPYGSRVPNLVWNEVRDLQASDLVERLICRAQGFPFGRRGGVGVGARDVHQALALRMQ
jgi:YD repeat-containing protein